MNDVPAELLTQAVSLQKIGVRSRAWRLKDVPTVIDWLETKTSAIVLGGDLYAMDEKGDISPMRENWYYEPTGTNDHQQSIDKARQALGYSLRSDKNVLVDLVIQ